jgi:F0F1-type ATP synthase assembly protein I
MRSTGSDYIRFAGIGFTFVLILVVFGAIGFFVDSELGTLPLFLLIGLVIGFAGGLYYLYRALEKLGKL